MRRGAFDARGNDGVVQRGGGVQADESDAVDGAGDDVPRGATQRGENEKHDKASDAKQQADAVGDGVGDFLDGMAKLGHVREVRTIVSRRGGEHKGFRGNF